MSTSSKFLIGLAAAILLGWIYHGPLGNGERFVQRLEAAARDVVVKTEVTGIKVDVQRDPLARRATLSGPADSFQRNGMGDQKGLTALVADVPGISSVGWADEPNSGGVVLPLVAETILQTIAAFLAGFAVGWFVWGRTRPRY